MKPKLLLLVVPFIIVVLLQGCLWTRYDTKSYKPGEEPDCWSYNTSIGLGAAALAGGIGSTLIFTIAAPAASDECSEPGLFCSSPRTGMYLLGGTIAIISATLAIIALVTLPTAKECNKQWKAHDAWLSGLSEKELSEYNKERCTLVMKYHNMCKETIEKDLNSSEINGLTKLHLAVKEANSIKTHRLIGLGADINAKDKYGWTPLHYAAQVGSEDIVEMLLKRGADPRIKDNEGKTPLDIAVEKGHEGVADILRRSEGR